MRPPARRVLRFKKLEEEGALRMKTDAQIQTDVLHELEYDPSITQKDIRVSVSDGVVTLSGSVPNFIEKSAAEKCAQRIAGVKAVVEAIEVKLPPALHRDDQELAKAIVDQFRWHAQIYQDSVKVSVENGFVQLTGTVEWEFQRRAAEKLVRKLTGVKGITNRIIIEPKIQPSDIKEKIEKALKRAAEREADRIQVEVHGGRVTLSGKVRSFEDLQDVTGAAWSAPGVTDVNDDDLSVAA
jgi:osmotically-inducible protein OsmY